MVGESDDSSFASTAGMVDVDLSEFDTRLPEPKKVKAKVRPLARKESSKAYNNKPPAVNTKLDNQKTNSPKNIAIWLLPFSMLPKKLY